MESEFKSASENDQAASVPSGSPRPWVKPALERIPLNEAMSGKVPQQTSDGTSFSTPS